MFQYPKSRKTWLVVLIIALAIVGLVDSLYLTYIHYQQGGSAVCNAASGACNVVTTSKYSVVAGIPLALLGVLFYLSVLALVYLYGKNRKPKTLLIFSGWTALGFAISTYLTYLQAFVIHAYCPLCLTSAASSILIFLSVLLLAREGNNGTRAGV
ncbi:MAG: hypothetical protein A2Y84_01580 [Candidatus Colwellbacteria bacterium RBG_13_48_8]|uniref:Vitamin K epoxide reductase domain-containing protein n=1 Tax=Candidatus Colwellbacteria bacterium RBG_13_48_8 TaxID=1797685 RepID=A0A1G1YXX8_9BACT|nr:MAG: hypothetical protein A2Y84_01580 [Candidatus Colwellbacteria bacterium RBG_13_48_8]